METDVFLEGRCVGILIEIESTLMCLSFSVVQSAITNQISTSFFVYKILIYTENYERLENDDDKK